jgi:5-methylthioadenosine/S-adenosylhomocysteine deaminase
MRRTVITGGYIVPMTRRDEVIRDGIVAFEDDRLVFVGAKETFDSEAFDAHRVVNAHGRAVLPGLVNTHIHLIGAYLKGITEDVPGTAAGLFNRALPILAECRDPDDVYFGSLAHAVEMVMTGTTTLVNTWHKEANIAPAVRDLGIRASLSEFLVEIGFSGLDAKTTERPWRTERLNRSIDAAIELFETWHGKEDGRITTRISPGGPGYMSMEGMARSRELADKLGLGINVHIAELPGETEFAQSLYGKRPIEIGVETGVETGVLGPDAIAIHCVFLSDSDIGALAESGATLSHTSYHVAKRGYFPPMEKVYPAGINVSLGSDWCSNDLWHYMRTAILIPRVSTGDVGMLSGYDVLEMATLGGARGLGMADEIGSLEAGKKADVVLIDVSRPWLMPIRLENFISNLVYNASGGDITDVFVDGRDIVRDREVVTIDRIEVFEQVQRRAERIWRLAEKKF